MQWVPHASGHREQASITGKKKIKQEPQQSQWFSGVAKGVNCFIPAPMSFSGEQTANIQGHIKHAVPKPSHCFLDTTPPYNPLLASDTTEETQGKVPPKGTQRKLLGARCSGAAITSYTCNTFTCHKQLAEFPVAGACPSFTAFLTFIWLHFGNIPVSCRGFTLETWKDTIPIIFGLFF